eukprot:12932375-Prorocentrum_lima.AAC.1
MDDTKSLEQHHKQGHVPKEKGLPSLPRNIWTCGKTPFEVCSSWLTGYREEPRACQGGVGG